VQQIMVNKTEISLFMASPPMLRDLYFEGRVFDKLAICQIVTGGGVIRGV
jgi:hypothetical protein